jgi:hypothetical protein
MPLRWFEFEPDLAVGQVTQDFKAGFFSIRLFIKDATIAGLTNPENIDFWKTKPNKDPPKWKVRVNIYQCESLPPADSNGTSDPYIEVWSPDELKVRTENCEDTNNPIYYESKEVLYEFEDLETAPPLVLNVFDSDEGVLGVGDSEDYIGRAVIFFRDLSPDDLSNDD